MQKATPLPAGRSVRSYDDVSNTDKSSETADHQGKRCKPASKKVVVTTWEPGRGELVFQIRCSKLITKDQLEAFAIVVQN